jgi:hypothetical protein
MLKVNGAPVLAFSIPVSQPTSFRLPPSAFRLEAIVYFLVAPKTMGEYTRLDFLRFLLGDEIHHRGQFSIYLRVADAKVPSIYGPTADEPWV